MVRDLCYIKREQQGLTCVMTVTSCRGLLHLPQPLFTCSLELFHHCLITKLIKKQKSSKVNTKTWGGWFIVIPSLFLIVYFTNLLQSWLGILLLIYFYIITEHNSEFSINISVEWLLGRYRCGLCIFKVPNSPSWYFLRAITSLISHNVLFTGLLRGMGAVGSLLLVVVVVVMRRRIPVKGRGVL